jgi:hypothetical protein
MIDNINSVTVFGTTDRARTGLSVLPDSTVGAPRQQGTALCSGLGVEPDPASDFVCQVTSSDLHSVM